MNDITAQQVTIESTVRGLAGIQAVILLPGAPQGAPTR